MSDENRTYWETLETLFHGALAVPAGERRSWVLAQCPDAPELAEEVLELLASHDTQDCRVGRAVSETARDVNNSSQRAEGRRLGAYRVLERLGQGGMGTVYLAERDDEAYRQKVAIKLIRGFPGDAALERMRRERQILADLNHPHIARLLDGGNTDDGQPYLVMEYVDGVPVVQWCRDRKLDEGQRLRLILDICDAVHYAHQHLVIHRDIKPGNVLITSDGRPVLLDFGIAKFISEPGTETVQTTHVYTPGYASPEQLAGKPVTTVSDIYSLGRLLLAVLDVDRGNVDTGERQDAVFRRTAWQRRLPRDLVAIAEQATRTEPELRYPTVAALRADLVNYLEGRAVDAVPDRLGYRLGKFVRRNRTAVAATALAAVIGLGLVWRWVAEYERARIAEAAATLEAEHARQVLDFLLDTIGAASPAQARGEEVTVREVVERGYQALLEKPDLEPALETRLLLALGELYQQLEAFGAADELLERASASGEPATRARALSLLGYGRTRQSRLDAAKPPLEQARALAGANPGLAAEIRLQLNNHWGLWLLEAGEADAARDIFTEVIAGHRETGAEYQAARITHNLALAERNLGNFKRAAELCRESLAVKAATVGRTDPSYATTLNVLSQVLRRLGKFEGAREALHESLESRIALFGEDHPGIHTDYNELGNAHHDLGEFDEAARLYERALRLLAEFDLENFGHAVYTNNLATAFEDRGDWARATPLFRKSLRLRRERLGDHHPSVALALHNLARNLTRVGKFAEAEDLIGQALRMRIDLLGDDHQATRYTQALYGTLAYFRGDWISAESIQREALQFLTGRLPDANLWVLNARGELARTLIELGRLEEAESLLDVAIADYHQALSDNHPHAALLELEMARIGFLNGHPDQAAEQLESAAPVLEQRMAPGSAYLRQLECLRAGETDRQCWLSTPQI